MWMRELHLERFKGFRDFRVMFMPFTALVGPNNGGKTSVLQAVRLVFDIFMYAFGLFRDRNADQPDFSNPQWSSDPNYGIGRLAVADPEAIWLGKQTAEPCKITLSFPKDIVLTLEIAGRQRYQLDLHVNGTSIKTSMADKNHRELVQTLFAVRPTYVSPIAGVSSLEPFIPYPDLAQKLDKGAQVECWRANLFWLCQGGKREEFANVVRIVQRYLPDVEISEPSLTRGGAPQVLITFKEDGTNFDIGTSGGGMRTILEVAAVLQLSKSRCLLFDEPDAHLHPELQRQLANMLIDHTLENDVQIIAATHAPDFIEEVPLEQLVWIDRRQNEGAKCDDISRVLADLGSVSKAEAIRMRGADRVLFCEGSLDRDVLRELFANVCSKISNVNNPFTDPRTGVAVLPSGKGDAAHLSYSLKLLKQVHGSDVKFACILDNDYDMGCSSPKPDEGEGPLVRRLGCKEIENYLIAPEVIARAIALGLQERRCKGYTAEADPSVDSVQRELQRMLNTEEIRDLVRYQVLPKYRETLDRSLDPSTKEHQADEWFSMHWKDVEWQRKNCPGKKVLANLCQWCQDSFHVSLTTQRLLKAFTDLPDEFRMLAQEVSNYLYG